MSHSNPIAMLLRRFIRQEWYILLVIALLVVGEVLSELMLPDSISSITRTISSGGTRDRIYPFCFDLIIFSLIAFFCAIAAYSLSIWASVKFCDRLRNEWSTPANGASAATLDARSAADLRQIEIMFAYVIRPMIAFPLLAIACAYILSSKSWQGSVAMTVAAVSLVVFLVSMLLYILPRSRNIRRLMDSIDRSFQNDDRTRQSDESNPGIVRNGKKIRRAAYTMMPIVVIILSLVALSVFLIGYQLMTGTPSGAEQIRQLSDMVVFSTYALMVIVALNMIIGNALYIPRTKAARLRIDGILAAEKSDASQ